MKVLGVVPARYGSSRFPGKPLADIHGKPMIWWVYKQAVKSKKLDGVIVAADDTRIEDACKYLDIPVMMTSDKHQNPADRIHEVSDAVDADLYIEINGDEPLVKPYVIESVIPVSVTDKPYVASLYTKINDPCEVADPSNIKVVMGQNGVCVYVSRAQVPFPKKACDNAYYKNEDNQRGIKLHKLRAG